MSLSLFNNKLSLYTKLNLYRSKKIWKPYLETPPADLDGCSVDSGALMPKDDVFYKYKKNNIGEVDLRLPHKYYTADELNAVNIEHIKPLGSIDKLAYVTVFILRRTFDFFTGYTFGRHDEKMMVRRVLFLETIAAIPGMMGAMIRHLKSIRKMNFDYGFIHTLLEEAENERMHLMTALLLKKPGILIKFAVTGAQLLFSLWYTIMYSLSPKYCHRFVGYLEEEAVKTYTDLLNLMDQGKLPGFEIPAPAACRAYWELPENASLKDVWKAIRADEAHHRHVNHVFANLIKTSNATNPFPPGY